MLKDQVRGWRHNFSGGPDLSGVQVHLGSDITDQLSLCVPSSIIWTKHIRSWLLLG